MAKQPSIATLNKKIARLESKLVETGIGQLWNVYSRSPIPTLIRNIRTKETIKYNHAMFMLTGYPHEEMPDLDTWLERIYPAERDRQIAYDLIEKKIKKNIEVIEHEVTITRKNGQTRNVEFTLYDVNFTGNSNDYQVVQALDVTERKRSNVELKRLNQKLQRWNEDLDRTVRERTTELKDSENRLKMALEGANEGLWVIDFTQSSMHFTAKSAEMLGYSLEELGTTSEKWDKITHPEDWPRVEASLNDHFQNRTPYYEAEYRARTKTGQWKWIMGHGRVVKRDGDGKPLQAIGTHVDITRLKDIEIELRKSEEKFRGLVESSPFGLLILNADESIDYFNPTFQGLFGYDQIDLPDLSAWLKIAYPSRSYRKKVSKIWNEMFLEPGSRKNEAHQFIVTCKNKEQKTVRVRFVTLNSGNCLVTYEDVTEIAQAQKTLEKHEKELQVKTHNLEEMNTALRVLLKRREEDRSVMEEKVLLNMKDLVIPYMEKLEVTRLNEKQKSLIGILKSNLDDIVSPFSRRLAAIHINLTPREIQVADMIKESKLTKEIAELLNISESSVDFHRHHIRRKLGLVGKKVNLKTYLQSLH